MFNFNLYQEGLRKTRTLAILFLAVMILAAILQPVIHLNEHAEGLRRGWASMRPLYIHGLNASYLSPFAFFFGAPLLTLSAFNFLNKRSSSDFYHAIPHKRSTLFVSFVAAVLTWVVGGMWFSTAISTTIYATSPHTSIYLWSIVQVQIGLAAACLLVTATFALAASVTGTKLSSFMTGLLILFVPRFLTTMFIGLVMARTRVVSFLDFGFFGRISRHIPFGFFSFYALDESFHQMILRGTFYTFALAMIYLLVGGHLFVKRHSEVASHPGTKITQPLIRIIITFLVTLPAIGLIIDRPYFGNNAEHMAFLITAYSIALIVYFAYEFMTARKLPKLTKMLPGIAAVALLNVVFILGIHLSRQAILQEVNSTDVTSVTIVDLNSRYWSRTYADLNTRGLTITDENVVELLAQTLNENIRTNRRRDGQWWQGHEVRITFHIEGSRDITRTIRVRNMNNLAERMVDYEPYQEIVLALPENPDFIELRNYLVLSHYETVVDLPEEDLRELYDLFREEVQNVDFRRWYSLVSQHLDTDSLSTIVTNDDEPKASELNTHGVLTINGTINARDNFYSSSLPITELTPRTLERFFELID